MRVIHVIDRLDVGGAERCVVELMRGAGRAGVETAVCLTRGGGAMAEALPPGSEVLNLNRSGRWDWRAARRFADWVERRRPDLLHVHGRSTLLFVRAAAVLRRMVPVLLHDHYGDGSRLRWALRAGASAVSRYVACSRAVERTAWEAGVSPERTETIPAALPIDRRSRRPDRDAARRRLGLPADALLAVCVGGLRAEKGQDVLAAALAHGGTPSGLQVRLLGGVRDAAFVSRLRARIGSAGLANCLRCEGERADIDDWLAAADFAVHPSRIESGPLALIEYLAAGLPVVCTRVGEVAAIAERNGIPGFVDAEDVEGLRREIDRLRTASVEDRRRRGDAGLRTARRELDLTQRMPDWLRAYQRAREDGCGY